MTLSTTLLLDSSTLQFQPHRLRPEQSRVHHSEILGYLKRDIDLAEHIPLQVNAGSDLGHGKAFCTQLKHAPLGHVSHVRAAFECLSTAERDVLDLTNELARFPFA